MPTFKVWMESARKTLRETPRAGEHEVMDALLNDFATNPPQMKNGEAETETEVCGRLREYCDMLAHGGGANLPKSHRRVVDSSMAEFQECAMCAARSGSQTLCPACFHNQCLVMDLNEKLTVAELDLENVRRRWEDLRAQLAQADSVRASNKYLEEAIHQIPDLGEDEDYRAAVKRVVQERDRLRGEVLAAHARDPGGVRDQLSEVIGSLMHVYVGNPAIKGLTEIVDDLRRVRDRLANTSSQESRS